MEVMGCSLTFLVCQELREVEELRDQLLDVSS